MISKENLHSKESYENIIRQPIAPGQADRNMDYHIVHEDTVKMEESFTIHLGNGRLFAPCPCLGPLHRSGFVNLSSQILRKS